jgi:hypothetical protein
MGAKPQTEHAWAGPRIRPGEEPPMRTTWMIGVALAFVLLWTGQSAVAGAC